MMNKKCFLPNKTDEMTKWSVRKEAFFCNIKSQGKIPFPPGILYEFITYQLCGFFKQCTQFLQCIFFNTGYIGAADVQFFGNFPLCLFFISKKSVPETDYLILFWRKRGFQRIHQK